MKVKTWIFQSFVLSDVPNDMGKWQRLLWSSTWCRYLTLLKNGSWYLNLFVTFPLPRNTSLHPSILNFDTAFVCGHQLHNVVLFLHRKHFEPVRSIKFAEESLYCANRLTFNMWIDRISINVLWPILPLFITADAKITTLNKFTSALKTQKPLSIMTTLPEWAMDSVNLSKRPAVFPPFVVKLWRWKFFWAIIALNHFDGVHDAAYSTAHGMILVSHRMGFPRHVHEFRTGPLICPHGHGFIKAAYPCRTEASFCMGRWMLLSIHLPDETDDGMKEVFQQWISGVWEYFRTYVST